VVTHPHPKWLFGALFSNLKQPTAFSICSKLSALPSENISDRFFKGRETLYEDLNSRFFFINETVLSFSRK
jgi:hypothetical protein